MIQLRWHTGAAAFIAPAQTEHIHNNRCKYNDCAAAEIHRGSTTTKPFRRSISVMDWPVHISDWKAFLRQTPVAVLVLIAVMLSIRFIITALFHFLSR